MKTFLAALLLATVEAATTKYSAAGNTPQGVEASKATATVKLNRITLTTQLTMQAVLTKGLSLNQDVEVMLCFMKEPSINQCSYCKVENTGNDMYTATHGVYSWNNTPPKLPAPTASLTEATNLTLVGLLKKQLDTSWGYDVQNP